MTPMLSENYVSHWRFKDAVRELLQNAIDQRTLEGKEIIYEYDKGVLKVGNRDTVIDRRTLLLGETDKRKDKKLLGEFGEGYKLAALCLLKGLKQVTIVNGNERWEARFVDSEFGVRVLDFDIQEGEGRDFYVEVRGVRDSDMETIKDLWSVNDCPSILRNSPGYMYIGGLLICVVDGYNYGYNFEPGSVVVDRDRKLISDYNLKCATADLLQRFGEGKEIYKMLLDDAPDTKYVEPEAAMIDAITEEYEQEFGRKIPVTFQSDFESAEGRPTQSVPMKLRDVLRKKERFVTMPKLSPRQQMEKLYWQYRDHMPEGLRVGLWNLVEKANRWYQ